MPLSQVGLAPCCRNSSIGRSSTLHRGARQSGEARRHALCPGGGPTPLVSACLLWSQRPLVRLAYLCVGWRIQRYNFLPVRFRIAW